MKYFPQKIPAPTKLHGGKDILVRKLLTEAPDSSVMLDAFGGTGVVTLNSTAPVRIINETHPDRFTVLSVVQKYPEELIKRLKYIDYSEEEFNFSHFYKPFTDVDRAVKYITLNRMSRSANMKDFGWSERLRKGKPEYISAWESNIENIPLISQRLKNVSILGFDAFYLIKMHKNTECFIFEDPPYMHNTRSSNKEYGEFELDNEQHWKLYLLNSKARCKIMICGYRNNFYDEWYKHWRRLDFDCALSSSGGKTKNRKIESIWMNYG
jgi:DNA adenine methylase